MLEVQACLRVCFDEIIYFNNLYLFQHYYFFIQSFTVYIEMGV